MKKLIKSLLRNTGYDIVKADTNYGKDPFVDMTRFVTNSQPIMFDVGANTGQTVKRLRKHFTKGPIHCFEPNPTTFAQLKENVAGQPDVYAWESGLAATTGEITFFQNSNSAMSSFLKLGENGWGDEKKTTAPVTTIDQFCAEQKIDTIDILKLDTQGFELEVLKGAEATIANKKIKLVYCEVIFSKMYEDLPSFGDLYNYLNDRGFHLVSIYSMNYRNNLASWTDLLLIHESYIKS